MQTNNLQLELPSRWPYRIAVLLTLVVFPLIWVGGLVTTSDAGMAVPDWPGTYGYNMFLYPLETWLLGPFDLLVEHGHRLLGALAGLIAIFLVAATWKTEPRKWVRILAVGILVLIIAQGILGGIRVRLDARAVAKIHGCVGPACFAIVAGFCVVTSRWWWARKKENVEQAYHRTTHPLTNFAMLMLTLSFLQLVIGAFIRHIAIDASATEYKTLIVLHIVMAVLIVLGTFTQWVTTRLSSRRSTGIRSSINVLMLLVVMQFLLGLGTWVVKFGWPVWFADFQFAATFVVGEKSFLQLNLITAHVAVGSLIVAFWTIHMLRCDLALGSSWLSDKIKSSIFRAPATPTRSQHTQPSTH